MRRPRDIECVALARDLPAFNLKAGTGGVVVHVYPRDAVEVEFMDEVGDTVAILTILDEDLKVLSDDEARNAPPAPSLPPGADVVMADATARAKR